MAAADYYSGSDHWGEPHATSMQAGSNQRN